MPQSPLAPHSQIDFHFCTSDIISKLIASDHISRALFVSGGVCVRGCMCGCLYLRVTELCLCVRVCVCGILTLFNKIEMRFSLKEINFSHQRRSTVFRATRGQGVPLNSSLGQKAGSLTDLQTRRSDPWGVLV